MSRKPNPHAMVTLPDGRARRCTCGAWFPSPMGRTDALTAHAAHVEASGAATPPSAPLDRLLVLLPEPRA